ncbi:hypothetical protein KR093_003044, partial [Drosophila rubida]
SFYYISVFTILLLAVSATSILGASFESRQYQQVFCRGNANGIRALVPGSCSKYFECQNGQATEYSCPNYYDFKTRSCVDYNPGCTEAKSVDESAKPK